MLTIDSRQAMWDKVRARAKAFLESRGIAFPRSGFGILPGWQDAVEHALDEMIAAGWDKDLHQVKQKFGGLRIYVAPFANDEVRAIIKRTEALVDTLCEYCGNLHGRTIPLSGNALCPDCTATDEG